MKIIENEIKNLIESGYIKNGWFNNEIKDILFQDSDKKIISCIKKSVRPVVFSEQDKIKSIFKAFSLFPMQETQVVVMGQAPYVNDEDMNGLFFLLENSNKKTNDLMSNIFTVSSQFTRTAMFETWSKNVEKCVIANRILLLNTSLTFENDETAQQHKDIWDIFINKILSNLINLKQQNHQGEQSTFLWIKNQKNILLQKIV